MKISEDILEEYEFLIREAAETNKRIEQIRMHLKHRGSFATKNYVCAVYSQQRMGLISMAKAQEILGLDFLIANDLINVSSFQIVKVTKKNLIEELDNLKP